jgi:hypothetical protein
MENEVLDIRRGNEQAEAVHGERAPCLIWTDIADEHKIKE